MFSPNGHFLCFISAKNVASDIAEKLCNSVATKLEGKVLGTFASKYYTVQLEVRVFINVVFTGSLSCMQSQSPIYTTNLTYDCLLAFRNFDKRKLRSAELENRVYDLT